MRVLAFIRVVPVGTETASISSYVAEAVKILESAGLKYEVTPFGTAVEAGSIREVAEAVERVAERLRVMGVPRLLIDISFDLRYDKEITLDYKVRSLLSKVEKVST